MRKIPLLNKTTILLTTASGFGVAACNGSSINVLDKVLDSTIYDFCEVQTCSEGGLYEELALSYCIDDLQDEMHRAKAFNCDEEHTDLLDCTIKEFNPRPCASDYESYDDYQDDLEDYYEDEGSEYDYYYGYSSTDDACEDENDDYTECINKFLGVEEGETSEDTGYEYEY